MDEKPANYVTVEIYDQTYHLSGDDPEHIRKLAALVDAKMRAVAAQGRTVDSLRVAVLAALNLADELTQASQSPAGTAPPGAGGRGGAGGPGPPRQSARAARRSPRGRSKDRFLGRRIHGKVELIST